MVSDFKISSYVVSGASLNIQYLVFVCHLCNCYCSLLHSNCSIFHLYSTLTSPSLLIPGVKT